MRSFREVQKYCEEKGVPFHSAVLEMDSSENGISQETLRILMEGRLKDMERSVQEALSRKWEPLIAENDFPRMGERCREGNSFSGPLVCRASEIALAVTTYNACMGRIVAAPTAGSCGIIPGILFSFNELRQVEEEALLNGLITAAGVGQIIARRATLAGAEGGCQAECGAASAMAAAALVAMSGGDSVKVAHAAAITIKSILGLVCDPVAGLVEVPCIKRNGTLVALAAVGADMAMAGIKSVIPPDEVIDVMAQVGRALPESLRETARGGLSVSPAARQITLSLKESGSPR
jgi:L-serine dehydratase